MSIWGEAFGARAQWGALRGFNQGSFSGPVTVWGDRVSGVPARLGGQHAGGFKGPVTLWTIFTLQLFVFPRGLSEVASHTSKPFPGAATPDFWANKQVWFYVQGSPKAGIPFMWGLDEAVQKVGAAGGGLTPAALVGCL